MLNITGLWKNKDKSGNEYFAGNLGNLRILIFPNNKKEKESHPDFNMVLDQNRKKDHKEEYFQEDTAIKNDIDDEHVPF